MNVRFGLAATLLVSATVLAAQAPQNPMRAGEWEITSQIQMAGVPAQMPEMKVTQCVTPEDLKDPNRALAQGPGQSSCKMSDYKVSGNVMTWNMACSAPETMTGSAELTFVGDTYTGTVVLNASQGQMTLKMAGKRLGDCTGR